MALGRLTSGPDETDVMGLMTAIQTVHDGAVCLSVRPDGTGFALGVQVTLTATFNVLPGSLLPREVTVSNPYPCKDHRTLWAHIFDGLYRLDAAIQRAYDQAPLPLG